MRAQQLENALTEFVEAAAGHLQGLLAAGAEVPFELEGHGGRRHSSSGSRGSVLYAYRAMTTEFIRGHSAELERLSCYGALAGALGRFGGLDRYLASADAEPARAEPRARVAAAVCALLCDVFEEQSDFEVRPERLRAALARMERCELADGRETTIVATLHGVAIASEELPLTSSLAIAQPHVLEGLPEQALAAGDASAGHLIVALAAGEDEPEHAIAQGCAALKELLRALRLFGDGRVTLGALAWARVAGGRWRAIALGDGGRPHGMLVVRAEQEDELRAFCNLVSRRAPEGDELAWALARFELGCQRERALDGLTDHLLALRALLACPRDGEPEGAAGGLLGRRLAALCAAPEQRDALSGRVGDALALERSFIAGAVIRGAGAFALVEEMGEHLRAILRDVICGHLDANLVGLADELLAKVTPEPGPEHSPAMEDSAVDLLVIPEAHEITAEILA